MSIEKHFDVPFIAALSLREKQIQQIHIRVPDWEKASALYREMIERWPGEVFTQFAIVKLATIQLCSISLSETRHRS